MAKVYLETSFFSACVWDRTDAKSISYREQSRRWWVHQRDLHELYASAEVLRELGDPAFHNRDDALALASGIQLLSATDDVLGLAKSSYVNE
jgi:hypothetical protein